MDKKYDLKPCPFCGGKPELFRDKLKFYRLGCINDKCPAYWTIYNSKETPIKKAVERWNNRFNLEGDEITVKCRQKVATEIQEWLNDQPEDDGCFWGSNIYLATKEIADKRQAELDHLRRYLEVNIRNHRRRADSYTKRETAIRLRSQADCMQTILDMLNSNQTPPDFVRKGGVE